MIDEVATVNALTHADSVRHVQRGPERWHENVWDDLVEEVQKRIHLLHPVLLLKISQALSL